MTGAQDRKVTVDERRQSYWIRIEPPTLGPVVADEIRIACLRGLERGVPKIVVDLTDIDEISAEGLDTLGAAADELRAKGGALWLANGGSDGSGPVSVPVVGLSGLEGWSDALDAALASGSGEITHIPNT